jgi:hypothetical protein
MPGDRVLGARCQSQVTTHGDAGIPSSPP